MRKTTEKEFKSRHNLKKKAQPIEIKSDSRDGR
jgi:hypothetical protein